MIKLIYAEDTGFNTVELDVDAALIQLKKISDKNIFIDGTLIKDPSLLTEETLNDASYIMIQNHIIGA